MSCVTGIGVTQLVFMNVQPLCCLPPLGGSVAADTNAHIATHPTPRLKPVSFRSCLMPRAWSMCSPLHLPLCALPGRRRSCRRNDAWPLQSSSPGGTKSQRRNCVSGIHPTFSPWAHSRTSKVSLVLWVMVAVQAEQGC